MVGFFVCLFVCFNTHAESYTLETLWILFPLQINVKLIHITLWIRLKQTSSVGRRVFKNKCKTGYNALSNLSQSEHWACVLSCYSVAKLCLFVTPWTVALQALLFMGFSCHEYWSGLPCPPPGDLPNPGIEPGSPHCRWILYHLSHQENLSGEWSSWIEFSEWCLLYFLSQMSPLNWIPLSFSALICQIFHLCLPPAPKGSLFIPSNLSFIKQKM